MDRDHVAPFLAGPASSQRRLPLSCVLLGLLRAAGTVRAQVTEDQKLLGFGGGLDARFGNAVALVETDTEALALVGAPRDAEHGFNAGAVYAYRYDEAADEWVANAKFWPKEVGENSFVGVNVALSSDGRLALVAGYEPGEEENFRGWVHLFRRGDEAWVEEATLVPDNPPPGGGAFGCSIAVSTDGEVIAVGACQDEFRGAVYIFRRDASSEAWVDEARLTTERGCFFTAFGAAVAVSAAGDRVVTAEPCGEGGDPPALYFFHRAGSPSDPNGGWVREARFDSYGGGAVALSEEGDLALAGPLFFSTVRVLQRDAEGWGITGSITPSSSSPSNFGGESIVLHHDLTLIGDIGADVRDNSEGTAHLFRHVGGGEWVEEVMLIASDGKEFDRFGYAGALSDRFMLIGAPWEGEAGALTGAVYAYNLARVVAAEPEVTATGAFTLLAYPNPFVSALTLSYVLPEPSRVYLAVYDVLGREVAVVADEQQASGERRTQLDARHLPAGLYVVRLAAGGQHVARRAVLLK